MCCSSARGLGKTSGEIWRANWGELSLDSGPVIARPAISPRSYQLEPRDVLFIDELPAKSAVEEILYPAMEIFSLI